MKIDLEEKCCRFADNRDLIAKSFKWESQLMFSGAAAFCGNEVANVEKMKECKQILNKKLGVLSSFRTILTLPMLVKMSLSDNPEKYVDGVIEVYNSLKKNYFFVTSYLALASIMIYENQSYKSVETVVSRTASLLKEIQQTHPFITSHEDLSLVALLALSDKNDEILLSELEDMYKKLSTLFPHHANSVQSLAMVLCLNNKGVEYNTRKVQELYDELKATGISFGKGMELAVLGTLCDLDETSAVLAENIKTASTYLKGRKGFGIWGTGEKVRLMYAALMVYESSKESSMDLTEGSEKSPYAVSVSIALTAYIYIMGMVAVSSASNAM